MNFSYKGTDSRDFQPYQPDGFCFNYQLRDGSAEAVAGNKYQWHSCAQIKLHLQNSLPIPVLR